MNQQYDENNNDDMYILKNLLQNIRGLSPVAGDAMELGFDDEEFEIEAL